MTQNILDQAIDDAIDDFEAIRAKLATKYGAAFTGLNPSEQSRVIRDIYTMATGKRL